MSNKILIKRTANPANDPTGLEPGELAVNLGTTPPNLYIGDGTSVLNLSPVAYTADDLSSGTPDVHRNGTFWIDPTTAGSEKIYFRANDEWHELKREGPSVDRVEESLFDIKGETSVPFDHEEGLLDVYLNGSKLSNGLDFSSDGTSVTLFESISSDTDVLHLVAWKSRAATTRESEDMTLQIKDELNPVGSVLFSIDPDDPNERLPGEWELVTAGTFLTNEKADNATNPSLNMWRRVA